MADDVDDADGEADAAPERPLLLRLLRRTRVVLVLVPLLVGLLVAAGIGAAMLWDDSPPRPVPEAQVRCWDRSVAPVPQCPEPVGVAGLGWVFPGLDPAAEGCRPAGQGVGVVCTVPLEDDDVVLGYRRESEVDAGLARIRGLYPGVLPERDGDVLVYRAPRPDAGRWSLVAIYEDHPFSVTVEAATARLRDLALAEGVDLRPAERVAVRSPGDHATS